jgi:hypothetical protein
MAAKEDTLVPLCDWIKGDAEYYKRRRSKESMIRQATVAYGIVELVVRCPSNNDLSLDDAAAEIRIDNLALCVCKTSQQQQQQCDDIKGVSMLSSGLSLSIEEPYYLSCWPSYDRFHPACRPA